MIFIIPIILGAAALSSVGVGAGLEGFSKIQEVNKLGKAA